MRVTRGPFELLEEPDERWPPHSFKPFIRFLDLEVDQLAEVSVGGNLAGLPLALLRLAEAGCWP